MERITEERLAEMYEETKRTGWPIGSAAEIESALRELQQRRQADREFREKCVQIISSLPKFRVAAPERTEK